MTTPASCADLPDVPTGTPRALRPHTADRQDDRESRELAVVLPGFLDTIRYASTTALTAALEAGGAAVVGLELHGAWTPGPPVDEAPLVDEYLTSRHLRDIRRVLDSHCSADRRTVLIGFCYGAQLAALTAADDARVTDVVALMPTRTFIWPDDYDPARDTWRRTGLRSFTREEPDECALRTFDVPYSVPADALQHRPAEAFASLQQRVLFVAAEDDEFVPPAAVRRLHDECRACNPHAEYETLAGVQHDYRGDRTQIDRVNATVLRWLALGAPRAGAVGAASTHRR